MSIRDISELKEKLKKGTISYFSLSQEEIEAIEIALKKDIEEDRKEIEDIKQKIDLEKRKLEIL